MIQNIVERIKRLAKYPLMGRIVPELNISDFRELIIKGYRIIYNYNGKDVEIDTIIHSKQDFFRAYTN